MSTLAAILVLVACPTGSADCVREPVRIVSFQTASDCWTRLDGEVKKAKKPGFEIYGVCNSFPQELLAGMPATDKTVDLKGLKVASRKSDRIVAATATGFAR
jgi:hypothetical protein